MCVCVSVCARGRAPACVCACAHTQDQGIKCYMFCGCRVAPHHANKNDLGPFGGALERGPPPPKAVELSPRTLEQVQAERILALRELDATMASLQVSMPLVTPSPLVSDTHC